MTAIIEKSAAMAIDSKQFRTVMSNFATGVTVVAACYTPAPSKRNPHPQPRPAGFTANAFASVSLDPPLILVCVGHKSTSLDTIKASKAFSVNILDASQLAIAQCFASNAPEKYTRFCDVPYHTAATGAPVFDDALGWLDCTLVAMYPGGDHEILLGEVQALDARPGTPLLYYQGRFTAAPEPD
jgi:flavin reductase (DIM6/NTAB) family NADH-FMN oxidoreductase RutF